MRVAVVGVGAFGRHHARIYAEMADLGVELLGIVDHGGPIAQEIALRYDVPLVATVEELPQRPDLVSVAVSTTQHRAVAEPLLRAGIHCLIEKPIAETCEDALALIEAATAGGAVLQVGHVERFNPVLGALESLAALGAPESRPAYVEVHRLAPFRARARDVGVVMDLMIHDLDILNHVAGEQAGPAEAVVIQAQAQTIHGGAEDVCVARLSWPTGCVALLTASRVASLRMRQMRVLSPEAWLYLDLDQRVASLARGVGGPEWEAYLSTQRARPPSLDPACLQGGLPAQEKALAASAVPTTEGEPLRAELESFVRCVREGGRPAVDGRAGLKALILAERILASLAQRSASGGV